MVPLLELSFNGDVTDTCCWMDGAVVPLPSKDGAAVVWLDGWCFNGEGEWLGLVGSMFRGLELGTN